MPPSKIAKEGRGAARRIAERSGAVCSGHAHERGVPVEQVTPNLIAVRHIAERHHYSFPVVIDGGGKRMLGTVSFMDVPGATHSGGSYMHEARAFAEREARKTGLVD